MGLLTTKIKSILDYYIDFNFHVSLCAISYILLIYNQTKLSFVITDHIVLDTLFVLTATHFAYNFIKYYELTVSKNKPIHDFSITFFLPALISFFVLLYIFFVFTFIKQVLVVCITFFTIAYTIPFYKKNNLRSYPIIKILTISTSWTLSIVVLPFYQIFDSFQLIYYSVIIFLMVTAQMVPFEIRDAKLDANYVKNSVNIYGLKTIKKVGYILLLSILVFQITKNQINNCFELHFSSVIILIIMTALIRKSTYNQSKYFSSLMVESIPIYWLIMELIL
tara:strand:+ start:1161 stop:1997 length:837 start_codon:yes stop_codon:yes gene_type:complete